MMLGTRMKELRKRKNLSQEQFAKRVNVSVGFIRDVERGLKTPSLAVFKKIVLALDTSADYLLRDDHSRALAVLNDLSARVKEKDAWQINCMIDIMDVMLRYLRELPADTTKNP